MTTRRLTDAGRFWLLYAALLAVMAGGVVWSFATHAQTIVAPTTTTPWQCQDASGAKLSDHADYVESLFACWNNRAGDRIQGGTYKLPPRTFPNRAPTISGTPLGAIEAGKPYAFTPTAADEDGDTLAFTIVNRPAWATFSSTTGALTGTPAATNVGVHSSIAITVSDGKASASTSAFSITVTAPPAPPPLTAATLATPTQEAGTNVGRYNVILTWSAVSGATAYRVNRCAGSTCSTMSVLASTVPGTVPPAGLCQSTCTYKNTDIPANTFKYQVYARRGTSEIGPASNLQVYTVTATPPPPTGNGTATLQWTPPTTNTDGSSLTNLAGFRIVYGTSQAQLTQLVQVPNASAKTHTVAGLAPGTWYFAVRAYTSGGVESANSNVASKVLVP